MALMGWAHFPKVQVQDSHGEGGASQHHCPRSLTGHGAARDMGSTLPVKAMSPAPGRLVSQEHAGCLCPSK